MIRRSAILFVILECIAFTIFAQNDRAKLEKERAEIQRQIDEVQHSLSETKKDRRKTASQLLLLQRKLQLREQAIQNINRQITVINKQVVRSGDEAILLQAELDTLRMRYERTTTYAYRNRSSYDILNFIFSASSFNDALGRISYLKTYHEDRQKQKEEIFRRQRLLERQVHDLKMHREERNVVLKTQSIEMNQLAVEKAEKNALVVKLKSREVGLTKELFAKQKMISILKGAISKEVSKHEKLEKVILSKKSKKTLNPKEPEREKANVKDLDLFKNSTDRLSSDFEKNRKKLPWPVESGKVTMEFGVQHPAGNPTIWQDNPGITISTSVDAPVKAVFDGEVSALFDIDGKLAIIIRHGKFLTTYNGLRNANVVAGQHVKMGETLGLMAEKINKLGELDFIITNDKNSNLNPRQWLR